MKNTDVCKSVFCALITLAIVGCEPPSSPNVQPSQGGPAYNEGTEVGAGRGGQRERQAALLNRLRSSDPQFRIIERAIFNEQNELGIILDRSVEMDSIPRLMRSILTEMAREFPGEDLSVIAYGPTQPPVPLGTARLDARTRDMTYTPARSTY